MKTSVGGIVNFTDIAALANDITVLTVLTVRSRLEADGDTGTR